jgi:Lrp/AsnC family transcriptional regulator, leucine-responsive regulatory protein
MDEKDREILSMLEKDGKARIAAIAKALSLPPSTVHSRISRMEHDGTIRRYAAVPDYRKTGLNVSAYILINVDYSGTVSQESIARELLRLPNVYSVGIVSGDIDMIAFVRAKDVDDLGVTIVDQMRRIRGVSRTVTSVVLKSAEI